MPQKHHPSSANLSPTQTSRSPIGSVVGLDEGEVLLPGFVSREANGLCVNPLTMGNAENLRRFVDRVYLAGACFTGLDCETLSELLYPRDQSGIAATPPVKGMVRIAEGIRSSPPERRELYKGIKVLDGGAQVDYLFEPALIERVVDVPIYGEDTEDQPQISGYGQQVLHEPTSLDIDEFVAAMWLKGVRSGIDIPAIKAAIARGGVEHVVIARRIDPVPGADASVEEKTPLLHRDDSPFILPNGRVDLSQFKNHFPQVSAGTCLLQKMARRFGQVGFDTDGSLREPDTPRDFELEELAGIGTRIERTAKGDFLLAARDGFLNIDKATRQISVTDKIINRKGVNIRTTGNLALSGDIYEEHGEVQERRVVDGKHMSFHADVYGNILSDGGQVHLMANLSGGSVRNPQGSIRIDHLATQATIDARGGEVVIKQAEGVSIVAGRVKIERAIACNIVADDVEIDDAAACSIAARRIRVTRASAYRDIETVLFICVPDFSELNKLRAESAKKILGLTQQRASKQGTLDRRTAVPEIKNYYFTDGRIRAGEFKLSPEQQMQWHNATQRLTKLLLEIKALQQDVTAIDSVLDEESARLAVMDAQRDEAGANTGCDIGQISGDVSVQTQTIAPGAAAFSDSEASDIKRRLRDPLAIRERLFRGNSGKYSWCWKPAAEET